MRNIKSSWSLHRNSKSYTGSYPEGYIKYLDKFIGLKGKKILHLFGGITNPDRLNHTNDINKKLNPTFSFDVREKFPIKDNEYDLILADPPYDIEKVHLCSKSGKEIRERLNYGENLYNTEFLPPYSFIEESVRILKPSGFLCVLHFLIYPNPKNCKRFAIIPIISGPNLRIRALNIFQKKPFITNGTVQTKIPR